MPRHRITIYHFDQDWLCTYLQEQYWKNQRSVGNISKDFDVTGQTILIWMRIFGIQRRTCKEACNIDTERKRRSLLVTGVLNPMKRTEVAVKFKGDSNPSKRPEVREKISIKLKGRIFTESHRKKISQTSTGRIHSLETRKLISISFSGCNNPAWLGGISYLPYSSLFDNKFKEYIREKFDRKCFICGKTEKENGQKLTVHHINYNKLSACTYNESFISVCISHNSKFNKNRWYWFNLLINYWCMNTDTHFMIEVVCNLGVLE